MGFWAHLKKLDWVMAAAVTVICAISLLTLYSINFGKPGFIYFQKQAIFAALGFLLMIAASFFDFMALKNYRSFFVFIYIAGLVLLVGVLFFGKVIRGTAAWFRVSELGFEPVELMKLIVILVLAKYFSLRHVEMYRARHVIVSFTYVFLPAGLILLQPDLGSVLVLGAIWMGLVILAGIKPQHLLLVLLGVSLVFSAAWFGALKPYQKERISTFLNPQRDPFGASYNLIQSKIAIGSGGIWGRGIGNGVEGRLDFLPEKHTDFIFAAFAEEWGFAGVLFLFIIYGALFYRLVKIVLQSENNFSRIVSVGICLMIFVELFINIGVTVGLLPITGISLPFMSYGGSALFVNFLAIGLVQSLYLRSRI